MFAQKLVNGVRATVRRFIREERAATAVEYAVIAAIVGIGLITVLQQFSFDLQDAFTSLSDAVQDGTNQAP